MIIEENKIKGIVITDLGEDDAAYAAILQPDGKIVVAGTSDLKIAITRYNQDGSLDNTFGEN